MAFDGARTRSSRRRPFNGRAASDPQDDGPGENAHQRHGARYRDHRGGVRVQPFAVDAAGLAAIATSLGRVDRHRDADGHQAEEHDPHPEVRDPPEKRRPENSHGQQGPAPREDRAFRLKPRVGGGAHRASGAGVVG